MMLKIKIKSFYNEFPERTDFIVLSNFYTIESYDDHFALIDRDNEEWIYNHHDIVNLVEVLVALEDYSNTKQTHSN